MGAEFGLIRRQKNIVEQAVKRKNLFNKRIQA